MQTDEQLGEHPRIKLETRPAQVECLVCSSGAASDCQDLAKAFADHFASAGSMRGGEALLHRVDRVEEWVVCDNCQTTLSGEDKVRLMCLWVVVEGMRNWLRTEMRLRLKNVLPAHPPVQLA